jgi:hypothetical protein
MGLKHIDARWDGFSGRPVRGRGIIMKSFALMEGRGWGGGVPFDRYYTEKGKEEWKGEGEREGNNGEERERERSTEGWRVEGLLQPLRGFGNLPAVFGVAVMAHQ